MPFQPSPIQADILRALRAFMLDGVPALAENGQPMPGCTHTATEGVPHLWLRAYLAPIRDGGNFESALCKALKELEFRGFTTRSRTKPSEFPRYILRPDGASAFLSEVHCQANVGRLTDKGTLSPGLRLGGNPGPEGDWCYSIGPAGLECLDSLEAESGNAGRKWPDPTEQAMGQPAVSSDRDTFLCHNHKDKPAVRDLKQQLLARDVSVWLDEDELRPGIPYQPLLEKGIKSSKSIAVLVGKDGLGPWQDQEMQAALQLAVKDGRPVIPVLLPDAPAEPELPAFLIIRTWVDLRGGVTDAGLDKLIWGIRGRKSYDE